ncbi:MAG: Do family serine endopeptidase [Magnetococcales bacterium]|nr:Do family serine endopeptidase [Magnetococcales bacterium]
MKRSIALSTLLLGATLLGAAPGQGGWPTAVGGRELPSLAPILEKVVPGVVNIHTTSRIRIPEHPLFSDPLFRYFFELPRQTKPREKLERSLGSGVVVDAENGYLLTNHHVIRQAERIVVALNDGRNVQATRVGEDPETDVAVIRIEPDQLTALPRADSDRLRVGDFVVAIGNPFGLGSTVTSGIVSALGRSGLGIEGYEDFIQTDASINPGNSGGALIDLEGQLVGINTAILARGGGNVGIGFAIPINMAHEIMGQLIAHGEVRRGLLGVQTQDLTPELATAFNLKRTGGAVVSQVVPRSGADRAGLRPGDVVIAANGRPVRSAAGLRNVVGLVRVGQKVKLEYLRDGETLEAEAVVTQPETIQMQGREVDPRFEGAVFELVPGTGGDDEESGIRLLVVRQGSPAWGIGLRPKDRLVMVNNMKVKDFEELTRVLRTNQTKMLLNIQRNGEGLLILVR